jgi:hypothetical protein
LEWSAEELRTVGRAGFARLLCGCAKHLNSNEFSNLERGSEKTPAALAAPVARIALTMPESAVD